MTDNFETVMEILPLYFSGEATYEERELVDAWRRGSPGNEQTICQLQTAWEAWPRLKQMEPFDATAALQKVHSQILSKRKSSLRGRLQNAAAILAFPLLLWAGYATFQNHSLRESAQAEPVWQTVTTPPGVKSHFYLPDSTSVWLNSSSSLTFPLAFSAESRQVSVDGEVFFDVRKNERKPFVVSLGKISVKVLGTRFNVTHFANEARTDIVLESGKISVCPGDANDCDPLALLKPGELARFDKTSASLHIFPVETDKFTSWINGKLIFRDDSMDEVVRRLNHWFNVQIEVADREILDYIYTATFTDESIDQILELLALSAPIRYQVIQREKKGDAFSAKRIILRKRLKPKA